MLGWIIAALAAGAVCSAASGSDKSAYTRELERENERLRRENNCIKLTIKNQSRLLKDYDTVNRYAKRIGYKGAVDFFYDLGYEHDERLFGFARFLNKVRHIRNDIAHNGTVYNIDEGFLQKLCACKGVCDAYDRLPAGRRLYLN